MEKYKIKGVGLDTSQLTYRPLQESAQPYIYIELRENNGYLASDIITDETQVIVGADFLDNLHVALFGLLSEIGHQKIDLLLISASLDMEEYQYEIRTILDSGLTDSIGIKQPETREQLEKAIQDLRQVIIPKYVSLNLSPLYFKKDIIDWADSNKLEILGFNPFGGYLTAPQEISSFGIPFLLSFASTYASIVFLSSRDLIGDHYTGAYLQSLIDREDNLELYRLDHDTDNLVSPIPKMVYSGFLDNKNLIPFENSSIIALPDSLSHSFSPLSLNTDNINSEFTDSLILGVLEMLKAELRMPDDGNSSDLMSIAKPRLLRYINDFLGSKPHQTLLNRIDSKTFLIEIKLEKIEKRLIGKDKRHSVSYDLLFTCEEEVPVLRCIETPIFK